MTITTWYRGDDGPGRVDGAPSSSWSWYAANAEYAAFFGSTITTVELADAALLDLREHGIGDWDTVIEVDGMPQYREAEVYLYAERPDVQAAALALGYHGIRVMQWHADYSADAEDTAILFA